MRLTARSQVEDRNWTWKRDETVRLTGQVIRELESARLLADPRLSALQVPWPTPTPARHARSIPLPEPVIQPAALVESVRTLLGQALTRKALARVYDAVDTWLNRRQYEACDSFLDQVQPDQFSATMLVGMLTITSGGREQLTRRSDFVQRTRQHLTAIDPNRVDQLLAGLE